MKTHNNNNSDGNPPPLLSKPHIEGQTVHCNNCGLVLGRVIEGGNLLLVTGHTLRFPTNIKCPPPCGKNIKLGDRFQAWRNYAKREVYPNPRPEPNPDTPTVGLFDLAELDKLTKL